jgi:hypothetical protein
MISQFYQNRRSPEHACKCTTMHLQGAAHSACLIIHVPHGLNVPLTAIEHNSKI